MTIDPELTMLYVHAERIGYARMGQSIANELIRRGVRLYDDTGFGPPTEGYVAPPSPTNVLSLMSVPAHLEGHYDGQYLSILTMWESRSMPPAFRQTFHEFDLIMVPSWHNIELFSQYHDNVQFVSLGVDPELWHPIPVTPPTTHFDFLIGGRGERKGVDLAYEAFRTVFPHPEEHTPIPRLIMKSMHGHGDYYHHSIVNVTGILEPEAERDLYASAHCYLQPSRGEGFGLQPLQAMSLGRPTILTDAHGHESFAHLGVGIKAGPKKAGFFVWGDAGDWWEPDFEELCEAMWDVYTNYETHLAKATESAAYIAENLTWSQTTDKFIEHHRGQLSVPYSGSGEWLAPTYKMYPVSVSRSWRGEIAGRVLNLEPGNVYYEHADIKRILYNAGVLSLECLGEDDDGLLPTQIVDRVAYAEEHSYCPTCHRDWNTGEKRSDKIFAELEAEAG